MRFKKSLLLAFVTSSLLLSTVEGRAVVRFDRRTAAAGDVDAASSPDHSGKTGGSGKPPSIGIHRRSNDQPPINEYIPPAPGFRKREFGEGERLVKRDQSNPFEPNPPGYKAPTPIPGRGGGKPPALKRRGGDPKHFPIKLPPYVEPIPDPGHPHGASDQLRKRDPQAFKPGTGVTGSPLQPGSPPDSSPKHGGGPVGGGGPPHELHKRYRISHGEEPVCHFDAQGHCDEEVEPSPGHPHAKRSTDEGSGFEPYPSPPYGDFDRRPPGHVNDEGKIHSAGARRSLDHLLERRDNQASGNTNGGSTGPPHLENHDNDYVKSFGLGKSPAPPQGKVEKRSPLQVSDDEGGLPRGFGGQTNSANVAYDDSELFFIRSLGTFGRIDPATGELRDLNGIPFTSEQLLFIEENDPVLKPLLEEGQKFDQKTGKPTNFFGKPLQGPDLVTFWMNMRSYGAFPETPNPYPGTGPDSDGVLGTGGKPGTVKGDTFYSDNSAIYITSSLDALAQTSEKPGYFGVCRCVRGPNDGALGKKSDTCTAKFIQDANKTAKCQYNTASDVSCTEQGGKPDMTDGDNIWWQQALCKRCVDAGGVSDPKFACPEGYAHDGKAHKIGKLDKKGPNDEDVFDDDKKDGTKHATTASTEDGRGISTKPAPSSADGKPAPGSGDGKPAPGSGDGKPAPGSGDGKPAPGSGDGKPAPGSGDGKPAPGSGDGKPAPGSGDGKPAPGSEPPSGSGDTHTGGGGGLV